MASEVAEIEYGWSPVKNKSIQISRIYPDGYLYLKGDPGPWIQRNPSCRPLVRSLELIFWGKFDVEEIGDSIEELTELTKLYIRSKFLNCLPHTFTRLHNLQVLTVDNCTNLAQLPANLGELQSLRHLSLLFCKAIKFLPDSIVELKGLTTLDLGVCESLAKLPENMKIMSLRITDCRNIHCLPKGLINLQRLHLRLRICSQQWFANLKDAVSLRHLTILDCSTDGHGVRNLPANLNELSNLESLSIRCYWINQLPGLAGLVNLHKLCLQVDELHLLLDHLPKLSFLDIEHSKIKFLPWSITNLPNLRFLFLPRDFRLETLPFQLNDSVIISVQDKHVRKTWKQLKTEMWPLPLPVDGAENPFILSPYGYLRLRGDPKLWIQHNVNRCMWVQLLDFRLWDNDVKMLDAIEELLGLTRLYIEGSFASRYYPHLNLHFLSNTITRLKHLSVTYFNCESLFHSLGLLSNLESLDLNLCKQKLPENLDVLVSLKHLTLQNGYFISLPDNMAKLSNLTTLDLYKCYGLSFPENMIITKLKLVHCTIKSFPTSLLHLEMISECCLEDYCNGLLEECLNQLVNLETLSLTCHRVEFLPSIVGILNLRELQLKDCINLRKLPQNLDKLRELCTLNLSGTRIKSLPDCISTLHKLQHLILPKCVRQESLRHNLKESMLSISVDDTDEEYYKDMIYSHYETSSEDNKTAPDSVEGVHQVFPRISQEGILAVHTSTHQWPSSPDTAPFLGGLHFKGRNQSIGGNMVTENQEMDTWSSESQANCQDMIRELSCNHETNSFGENSQCALRNEQMGSYQYTSSCDARSMSQGGSNHHGALETGQNNNNLHSEDKRGKRKMMETTWQDMQKLTAKNMTQVYAAKELADGHQHERNNVIAESSHHAFCSSRNQEMEMLPSASTDCMATFVDDATGGSCSELHETESFDRNNQQAIGNVGMAAINLGNEQGIAPHSGNNPQVLENSQTKNHQSDRLKFKSQKIDITREMIQPLLSKNITLVDAAEKLGAKRSTLKRRLKEFGMQWPRSNKRKHLDAEKTLHNTEPPSRSSSSQLNLVNPTSLTSHDHVIRPSLDHNLPIEWNIHNSASKYRDDAELHTLSSNGQLGSTNSSTLVVKATYKELKVKFKWASTASLSHLKKAVADNLQMVSGKFGLSYQDEENDWLIINTKEHLEDALSSVENNILRLNIIDL